MLRNKMFKLDRMLMIGSAGANAGKTELGCALVRKFHKKTSIIGIKVTTIKEKDGKCPRGGRGCGVCSSLDGDFCITEEANRGSGKDTTRLLMAGANRVFWLRTLRAHLDGAINALLDVTGSGSVMVCESNSLRQVVEPGVFLVVKGRNENVWKSSARQVRRQVDRIVVSDGGDFDFDLSLIELTEGKWTINNNFLGQDSHLGYLAEATAIILAGGKSRRMGTDKAMLTVGGRPMIERVSKQLRGFFDEILVSSDDVDKFGFLGFNVIKDRVSGQGPLMGIASALQASANDLNFIVACDIPDIDLALVHRMLDEAIKGKFEIVVPAVGDGKYEPLFAVYRKSTLKAINDVLASGGRKISDVFAYCKTKFIELDGADRLVNLNTMTDYKDFTTRKCT
jgi:molybdenum cofactor guanylyltransferase